MEEKRQIPVEKTNHLKAENLSHSIFLIMAPSNIYE